PAILTEGETRIVFGNLKRFRRSFRVARTGARIYFGYKRTQRRVRKLPEADRAAEWEKRHEKAAEQLYRLAIGLRGMYIKSGQFIGTRSDLVPAPYVKWLSGLQDRVPPHPLAVVRKTIEKDFGRPLGELFATFDDEPIAAASLAQVHRATLPGGREVAVKVQYPEVDGLVRLDIRNLRTIVRLVARFEPNFDYRAIVDEIGTQVPLELDFEREGRLTTQVGKNLAAFSQIQVPEVVAGYVSRRVLVTEYVHGARLLDTARREEYTRDPVALAQTIADAYGHQIMVDGLFQADPHPGNILVLPGGDVCLLDFGLTKELPDSARLGFARLVLAVANRNTDDISTAFRELGVRTSSDDPESLLTLMQVFFDARPVGEGAAGRNLRDNRAALQGTRLEAIPGDLVLLGRVVGLLRGVCASLGTPLSPMQMLRPHAERALREAPAA
ncbi:MAG: AarF/ABC1/UbiB kinase family protein, partial [Dehalococcoidia bacterium]